MLAEAEKYAAEDAEVAERVQVKNGLESLAYSLKSTLSENGDKFSAEDKAALESKVEETIKFLDTADAASKEELTDVQKSLEEVSNPIMQRFYAASGGAGGAPGGGAPGGFPGAGGAAGAGHDEPSVEEVD